MQQRGKGKKRVLEPPERQWCQDHGLECKLRPSKPTLCEECCEVKVKCERPRDEKPEQKQKQA